MNTKEELTRVEEKSWCISHMEITFSSLESQLGEKSRNGPKEGGEE